MASSPHTPYTPDYATTHPAAYRVGDNVGEALAVLRAVSATHASTDKEAIRALNLSATQALAGDLAVMELVQGDGETLAYDGAYIAAAVTGARNAVAEVYEEMGVIV